MAFVIRSAWKAVHYGREDVKYAWSNWRLWDSDDLLEHHYNAVREVGDLFDDLHLEEKFHLTNFFKTEDGTKKLVMKETQFAVKYKEVMRIPYNMHTLFPVVNASICRLKEYDDSRTSGAKLDVRCLAVVSLAELFQYLLRAGSSTDSIACIDLGLSYLDSLMGLCSRPGLKDKPSLDDRDGIRTVVKYLRDNLDQCLEIMRAKESEEAISEKLVRIVAHGSVAVDHLFVAVTHVLSCGVVPLKSAYALHQPETKALQEWRSPVKHIATRFSRNESVCRLLGVASEAPLPDLGDPRRNGTTDDVKQLLSMGYTGSTADALWANPVVQLVFATFHKRISDSKVDKYAILSENEQKNLLPALELYSALTVLCDLLCECNNLVFSTRMAGEILVAGSPVAKQMLLTLCDWLKATLLRIRAAIEKIKSAKKHPYEACRRKDPKANTPTRMWLDNVDVFDDLVKLYEAEVDKIIGASGENQGKDETSLYFKVTEALKKDNVDARIAECKSRLTRMLRNVHSIATRVPWLDGRGTMATFCAREIAMNRVNRAGVNGEPLMLASGPQTGGVLAIEGPGHMVKRAPSTHYDPTMQPVNLPSLTIDVGSMRCKKSVSGLQPYRTPGAWLVETDGRSSAVAMRYDSANMTHTIVTAFPHYRDEVLDTVWREVVIDAALLGGPLSGSVAMSWIQSRLCIYDRNFDVLFVLSFDPKAGPKVTCEASCTACLFDAGANAMFILPGFRGDSGESHEEQMLRGLVPPVALGQEHIVFEPFGPRAKPSALGMAVDRDGRWMVALDYVAGGDGRQLIFWDRDRGEYEEFALPLEGEDLPNKLALCQHGAKTFVCCLGSTPSAAVGTQKPTTKLHVYATEYPYDCVQTVNLPDRPSQFVPYPDLSRVAVLDWGTGHNNFVHVVGINPSGPADLKNARIGFGHAEVGFNVAKVPDADVSLPWMAVYVAEKDAIQIDFGWPRSSAQNK